MTDGLLRQRRNLLIACILLWILKYGGIEISKFSLAGFEISVANPKFITTTIWIGFFYFLYRYYQYFSSEGVQKLSEAFHQSLELKCAPLMATLIKEQYADANPGWNYSYQLLKNRSWRYHVQKPIKNDTGVIISMEDIEVPITRWTLRTRISAAVIDTIFRNNVVTDYLLPFALAGAIIWYCGPNDWIGGLMGIPFPL